jgi:hypothetical protein
VYLFNVCVVLRDVSAQTKLVKPNEQKTFEKHLSLQDKKVPLVRQQSMEWKILKIFVFFFHSERK